MPPILTTELSVSKDGTPLYEHNKIIRLLDLREDLRSSFCQKHSSLWQSCQSLPGGKHRDGRDGGTMS